MLPKNFQAVSKTHPSTKYLLGHTCINTQVGPRRKGSHAYCTCEGTIRCTVCFPCRASTWSAKMDENNHIIEDILRSRHLNLIIKLMIRLRINDEYAWPVFIVIV